MDLPKSTEFNRRIPKQRFYDNAAITPEIKRVFIEQIRSIRWRNKIAPSTINVAEGKMVNEVQVIEIEVNQPQLDRRVLPLIDRTIPYHLLFLLVHGDQIQAWIGYKEQTEKPSVYYHSQWLPKDKLQLGLEGLNMDAVYENLVRQIAGDRLVGQSGNLKSDIERDTQRQKLQREIAALENRIRQEKQFNIQVELNGELKELRKELEGLL